MQPLPRESAPDWKRYVLRMAIWFAFVLALGYAVANGGLGILENDIHLSIEPNRDRIALDGKEPTVIQVKVLLRNNTREEVTLTAPSACKLFRWQVFSRSGDMVQSKVTENTCPNQSVSAILPSGETLEEFYSIELVPSRYRAGDDYLVHYWYWGHEGQFQFTAD